MGWLDAVIGGVFNGISSRSANKEQNRRTKEDRKHDLRLTEYEASLADYFRRKQRSEMSQGWDNWMKPGAKPNASVGEMPRGDQYFEDRKD